MKQTNQKQITKKFAYIMYWRYNNSVDATIKSIKEYKDLPLTKNELLNNGFSIGRKTITFEVY